MSTQNRRGRPATGQGTPIGVRLQPELLIALDRYIAREMPGASRAEAIRYALRQCLVSHGITTGPIEDQGLKPEELNAENDG